MKTETTLNFTASQLQQLKSIVDTIGWSTRNEDGKIETYVAENRQIFARELAGVLNRMEEAAIVGTSHTS